MESLLLTSAIRQSACVETACAGCCLSASGCCNCCCYCCCCCCDVRPASSVQLLHSVVTLLRIPVLLSRQHIGDASSIRILLLHHQLLAHFALVLPVLLKLQSVNTTFCAYAGYDGAWQKSSTVKYKVRSTNVLRP